MFDSPGDDEVSCGQGHDTVVVPELRGRVPLAARTVPRDCESVDIAEDLFERLAARPLLGARTARWSVPCAKRAPRRGCDLTFKLYAADGELLGRGRIVLARGKRASVRIPLNEPGRRLSRRGGTLGVRVWIRRYVEDLAFTRSKGWSVVVD